MRLLSEWGGGPCGGRLLNEREGKGAPPPVQIKRCCFSSIFFYAFQNRQHKFSFPGAKPWNYSREGPACTVFFSFSKIKKISQLSCRSLRERTPFVGWNATPSQWPRFSRPFAASPPERQRCRCASQQGGGVPGGPGAGPFTGVPQYFLHPHHGNAMVSKCIKYCCIATNCFRKKAKL